MSIAQRFQQSALRLVTSFGGGHTATLRRYHGTTPKGAPLVDIPYSLGSYAKDERDGVAGGTRKIMIATEPLSGVDLTVGQYRLANATGELSSWPGKRLVTFEVLSAGGQPALYIAPLKE